MAEYKTPGVYIEEINAFPSSVVQVPTGIPVFVGYTEKAALGGEDVTGAPVRISSMMDYMSIFGGAPKTTFNISNTNVVTLDKQAKFKLYQAMCLFFSNGGGTCWIVSVGDYNNDPALDKLKAPLTKTTGVLEKTPEPTIICIPEAVELSKDDWATLNILMIDHCAKMKSRVALVDVYQGNQPRNNDTATDVISGTGGLRAKITAESLDYAAAYYPWLNTSIYTLSELALGRFDDDGLRQLRAALNADKADLTTNKNQSTADTLESLAAIIGPSDGTLAGMAAKAAEEAKTAKTEADNATPANKAAADKKAEDKAKEATAAAQAAEGVMSSESAHKAAMQLSPRYATLFKQALKVINVMPPSPAMAGVYVRTDNSVGVFKAPANTGLTSVVSPTVDISDEDQEDLNIPLDGKAVNAIRTFIGRGLLVWGARTMDGNSQDWRYINVRRTLIMLEQSIKFAVEPYVFAPNTAATWVTVNNVISNFLNNQWKAGALAGSTPEEAYSVDVGLGSTMTPNDVLDGYMNVVVKVAIVRPTEFIVLQFQQKMQTS